MSREWAGERAFNRHWRDEKWQNEILHEVAKIVDDLLWTELSSDFLNRIRKFRGSGKWGSDAEARSRAFASSCILFFLINTEGEATT